MKRLIFGCLAVAVTVAVPASAQRSDTLSVVDLYGLRTISEARVRNAIGLRMGSPVPQETEAIRQRLRAIPGVQDAEVSVVCCADNGGRMMYVGIREQGARGLSYRAAPSGIARLPDDIARLGDAFEAALVHAVRSGNAGEDHSQGYALSSDSVLRAIQEQFVAIAAKRMDTLRVVIRTSAEPSHRALAAYIIAYGRDRRAIVQDLLYAVDDADGAVRNNAIRAIGVLASWLNEHPEANVTVPADRFISLLNALSWTDRNKGVMVLMALTAQKDRELLSDVRMRALRSLIEMARWTNPGHALGAYIIIARVAGVDDGEAFQAWQAGRREEVITRAEKLMSAEQQ